MSFNVSAPIKIVALVGILAALGLGGMSMLMGRSQPESFDVSTVPLKHFKPAPNSPAAAKAKAAAPAKHAAAPAKSKAKPAAAAKAAPAPKAAKPKVKPKPLPAVTDGLPTPLYVLLHGHKVVVVALWDPEVPSDRISFLEAQAGAQDANAGFLGVNVLDERVSGPLTALAGGGTLLPAPGVLVFKQPAMLMNRIDGFADRDAIAEAVANALLADAPPSGVIPAPPAPAAPAAAAAPATLPAP
jgi:hypothetical protein